MLAETALPAACACLYGLFTVLIAARARQRVNVLLAGCCGMTACWAGAAAISPQSGLGGAAGVLDLARALAWYGFLLHLYARFEAGSAGQVRAFALAGAAAVALGGAWAVGLALGHDDPVSLFSLPILTRLGIAIGALLLVENLYLNLPEHARWHVAVPCVLLAGLACFDVLLCADLVLFRQPSPALAGARLLAMMAVAPLLIVAAIRGGRWDGQIKLSRSVVFHSASLILSGAVLLALGTAGEVLRHLDGAWGGMAEISLVFAGLIGLGLLASSRSARSALQRAVLPHFFADRYDYRRQWLDCIATLSDAESDGRTALHARAIRAVADVVDSPAGVLFLREAGVGAFTWAGSWNMKAASALPPDHPVVALTGSGEWIVDLSRLDPAIAGQPPLDQLGRTWLAVPLPRHAEMIGLVVLAPPRVPFRLDQEVFDLLRILGREVATYVAEQRATQVMLQTRHLHDYGKRFAFVAHDIKNVSSQLALLLRNAERHIANPEFQRDMLETVGASVQKITALLKRLEQPQADPAPSALTPLPRLQALLVTYRRIRGAELALDHDGSTGSVAMSPDGFDTAITHLLNNAVEAAPGLPVRIALRHEASRVVIDIADSGPGMTPDFIRDRLFEPFKSQKQGGSGIGAFQARELIREGGGDVVVMSGKEVGTTIRVLLPRSDAAAGAPAPGGSTLLETGV